MSRRPDPLPSGERLVHASSYSCNLKLTGTLPVSLDNSSARGDPLPRRADISYTPSDPDIFDLDPLPPSSSRDFESLFCTKLARCHSRCCASPAAKLQKSRHLCDILRALETPLDVRRFSPTWTTAILAMVRANLSRSVPLIDPRYLVTDDVQPFTDPEWDHIGIVYHIFYHFQELSPRCPQIDLSYMRMICEQIGSRDEREQTAIHQIILRYCAQSRAKPVAALCTALGTELMDWEGSPNFLFAVNAVMGIIAGLVRDFLGAGKMVLPLASQCVGFLTNKNFLFFKTNFFNLVTIMMNNDPNFGGRVLRFALQFWPHKTSSKQAVFLKLFGLVMPKLPMKHTAILLPKVLGVVAECVQSTSARVSEAALTFLTDRSLDGFVMANAKIILPAVFEVVLETQTKHWNMDVRELAKKAVNRLTVLDPRLSHELLNPREQQPRVDFQAMLIWVQVTEAASRSGHQVGKKLAEISRVFGTTRPKPPILVDTRQIRRQSAMSQVQLPALVPVRDASPPPMRFPLPF